MKKPKNLSEKSGRSRKHYDKRWVERISKMANRKWQSDGRFATSDRQYCDGLDSYTISKTPWR